MPLEMAPRLADPDGLFAALVAAHDGLDPAASRRLDAALVLLLASVTRLLLVVKPRLSSTAREAGFARWAALSPAEVTLELAADRTAEHVVALSRIFVTKTRGLQHAVSMTLATGAPLAVAVLITAGGALW